MADTAAGIVVPISYLLLLWLLLLLVLLLLLPLLLPTVAPAASRLPTRHVCSCAWLVAVLLSVPSGCCLLQSARKQAPGGDGMQGGRAPPWLQGG